jgi:hypothetical protein
MSRPIKYLIVLTDGEFKSSIPAADYIRQINDDLTIVMPDRSSFSIDMANKRIQWPGFETRFDALEIQNYQST